MGWSMTGWSPATERDRHEMILSCRPLDFSAAFVVVGNLRRLIDAHPEIVSPKTVDTLARIITGTEYANQRQAFFLYKAAAEVLTVVATKVSSTRLAGDAVDALRRMVHSGAGPAHRAAAEALGTLPVAVEGSALCPPPARSIGRLGWKGIVRHAGVPISQPPVPVGRCLTAPVDDSDSVLVVKTAGHRAGVADLNTEAAWADRLANLGERFSHRFDIPKPIRIHGRYLFLAERLPAVALGADTPSARRWAIAFLVHRDYFRYPNDHRTGVTLPPDRFKRVMCRVAGLMGELTGMGIIHTAPIPLFHNRVQGHRRNDGGVYDWRRGGRLDQWLASCRYPNFGLTGLRDLEHLEAADGSATGLYFHIGAQMLSLLLAAGSYFRNRAPERIGISESGRPVDARDLFDRSFFLALVGGIFQSFFTGFTGEACDELPHLEVETLVDRMIAEMGVDSHMEEILRVPDQEAMTDAEFRAFLRNRGIGPQAVESYKRGEREITLQTGPHLGGFNQRISLPELIRFLETAAALCIARRFEKEQTAKPLQFPDRGELRRKLPPMGQTGAALIREMRDERG